MEVPELKNQFLGWCPCFACRKVSFLFFVFAACDVGSVVDSRLAEKTRLQVTSAWPTTACSTAQHRNKRQKATRKTPASDRQSACLSPSVLPALSHAQNLDLLQFVTHTREVGLYSLESGISQGLLLHDAMGFYIYQVAMNT